MVTEPTRNVKGQTCNILDLLFTNDNSIINSIDHSAPLGSSDHDVLLICVNIPKIIIAPPEPRLNFSKTDFKGLKEAMSKVDWSILSDLDIDQSWDFLTETLHSNFDTFVPKTKVKSKSQPFWLNKKVYEVD